jgi:hypothetical protein
MLYANSPGEYRLELIDLNNHMITSIKMDLRSGYNNIGINDVLYPGLYVLKLFSHDSMTIHKLIYIR